MLHFWLMPMLLLNVVFAALIGLHYLRPYENQPLATLFASLHDCPAPCWSGIRPGETTLGDFRIRLNQHIWVGGQDFLSTVMPDTGAMTWTWDLPPDVPIDETRRGIAGVESGVVAYIQLPTRVRFGDIWLAYGPPNGGETLNLGNELFPDGLRHFAAYTPGAWRVHVVVRCPVTRRALWESPVDIWLGAETDVTLGRYHIPTLAECAGA